MVRISTAGGAGAPDHTSLNLTRMLARLNSILITPDQQTEHRLKVSEIEREKVGTNLQYASSLLTQLEKEAQNIKNLTKKQEAQTELVRKREVLLRLEERLEELNDLAHPEDDDTSEGEDLIGEDTPSEETDSHTYTSPTPSPSTTHPPVPSISAPFETSNPPQFEEPTSTLRSRTNASQREELFNPSLSTVTTGISPRTSHAPVPTTTKESLLTHNRTEQEALTSSLLSMASALKESSKAFAASLDDEKDILDHAGKGMDKNEEALNAASKKMGLLRGMTEGKGWWGRIMLYAWIAGLMVAAILIVFVMPKLRF
ncbi:hypothetical protein HYFRA_00012516 [Hymenoscyphus fraxineus]|uniref:Synaptobrevin n=1 Tax=Hymenoscyphus fraxineus TaxID=746836 RepID=A0A9N9PV94_9HELO|nr:hypothetical protein HYFRA_00012516 [Hymenoscyphus fraxineus]